jgi:DNA processing protein
MEDVNDERAMYVALAMTPGIGPQRLATVLEACHSALGAHSAPFAFLSALPGFSRAGATAIKQARPEDGRAILEAAARLGATSVLTRDPAYPERFRHLADPPPLLFLAGDSALVDRPAVAIVGSRDHTTYGAEVCRTLAGELAAAGIVVVSGMARGLDAIAHIGALEARGGTIGVLGNGLGVVYPAANRDLYDRVRDRGLLLTEFPPGERPSVYTFPRRNRLISALAQVTVVVEAALGSGALITAECALEQGKDVMAVPGNVTSHTSSGTNRLIRDGAAPVLEVADVLRLYDEVAGSPRTQFHSEEKAPDPPPKSLGPAVDPTLTPEQRVLLSALQSGPLGLDDLVQQSGLEVPQALAGLLTLELAGQVEPGTGGRYRAIFTVFA